MNSDSSAGLAHAKLYNIKNLILEWSEAAGPFLSIEPLMRYVAEVHESVRDKAMALLKGYKSAKNKQYVHYWDCNPKYLVGAIESEFGSKLHPEALTQITQYPDIRDKFLHGNFIELMRILEIKPVSRRMITPGVWEELKPGEIYEAFLSMKKNEVFKKLRLYSSNVTQSLHVIITG